MQQKVTPERLMDLALQMKQLDQRMSSAAVGKIQELRSLVNETRADYNESGVGSAASALERLLGEVETAYKSVSEQLRRKQSALKAAARIYQDTENKAKSSFQPKYGTGRRTLKDMFSSLMDAAKNNMQSSSGNSGFSSFIKNFMGVLLEIQESALINQLQPYKDDPKIRGLIEVLSVGTPEQQVEARKQLGQIAFAFHEIARNQVSYDVYKAYGNVQYMQESQNIANAQREKLLELGVSEEWYNKDVNLSGQYKDTVLSALSYNPYKTDHSPMPTDGRLLKVIEYGMKYPEFRDWAKVNYSEIELAVQQAIEAEQEAKRLKEEADRLAEEEASKNMLEKSWDSFKEIGSDIWQGMTDRNNKKFDSIYDFGNYITSGAFDAVSGFVDGMENRADKAFDSGYDFFNWLSMGAVDTVNGAINPDEPFSKEHWMNSLGVVMMVAGAKGALSKTKTPVLPKNPVEVKAAQASKILDEVEERIEDSSKILEEQIRKRVLENIGKSKIARAASNFDEYLKKEKELLEEIEKKRAIEKVEGKGELNLNKVKKNSSGIGGELYRRSQELRSLLPEEIRDIGNFGLARVEIHGLKKEFKAHSQVQEVDQKWSEGYSPLPPEKIEERIFEPKDVNPWNEVDGEGAYSRKWDTEYKILEDVAKQLGGSKGAVNKEVTGKIDFYTDREPCASCTPIIQEFKEMFPNVEVVIYFNRNLKKR